jgi:hypothetical protein
MKAITKETPRVDFVVQGLLLKVPEPFSVGDVLETEGEAGSCNQTYRENVRNNIAKEITTLKESEKDELKQLKAAQAVVDKYCTEYKFGVRSGGGRSADPVMTVALGIAKDIVKEAWRKKGKKVSDYTAADLTAAARKVVEANDQLVAYAKKEIEAKKNARKNIVAEVD